MIVAGEAKHAVYTGTRNVYADMETSAKSLVANSDVDAIHFLIEDDEFPVVLPEIIECRKVSWQPYFPPDGPNVQTRFTYMALRRAVLWDVLDVDVALSLDCDTVAVGDCSAAWDVDVSGCYFAAVQERWPSSRPGLQYCNVGVSLLNLEMLRDGKGAEIVSLLNSRAYSWPEQDAMNYLCQGRIAEMPPEYNRCPWTVGSSAPDRIIHFAAEASWPRELLSDMKRHERLYREMTWDEAMERHEKWER